MQPIFLLESKLTANQFFQGVRDGAIKWTDFRALAARYDSATGAALAAISLDLEKHVTVKLTTLSA